MQLGLSERDRRTLIVGGSVIGALFALGRGVPALLAWQNTQLASAASTALELAVARDGVRRLPSLRDSVRVRSARVAAIDSIMLSGITASAAAADLASSLEAMAEEAAVKVSAMQLHADSAVAGTLAHVGVRVTATADVYGLFALLRAIEGGQVLLVVRESGVTQPEPAAPSSQPESLRLELLVVGLARIAASQL